MRLRDYLAVWPPIWLGTASDVALPREETGRLSEVRYSTTKAHRTLLVIEHEGKRFTGCLVFRDGASCERATNFLQVCRGKEVVDIGNSEITFSVFSPLPGKSTIGAHFGLFQKLMPRQFHLAGGKRLKSHHEIGFFFSCFEIDL
jgi:hypothetical protein